MRHEVAPAQHVVVGKSDKRERCLGQYRTAERYARQGQDDRKDRRHDMAYGDLRPRHAERPGREQVRLAAQAQPGRARRRGRDQ